MMSSSFDSITAPSRSRKAPRSKESNLSPDTRMMLKEFMKASKLNNNQTKFLDEVIRDGTALPKYPGLMAARPSTVLRQMTTSPSQKAKVSYQARPGIRTLDKIKETGMYEMEQYVPRPTKDLSGEKNKLQDIMSGDAARMQKEAEQASIRQLDPCPIPDRNETMDEMSMLIQEIKERKEWLSDMATLGRGSKYEAQIRSEISTRINRLRQIEKER